jgi:hypothetical protein
MSHIFDASTTISTAILALFTAFSASAFADPDEVESRASLAAPEREGEAPEPDALDLEAAPELLEAPAPKGFYIEKVVTLGKGCPDPASVAVQLSPDKTTLRLAYKQMSLKTPPALQTTNCQATLSLRIPAGWQVALASLKTRGYAKLGKDVKAHQRSSAFFAGVGGGVSFDKAIDGPYDGNYYAIDVVPPASVVWSPCGGSALFSVNNSLILNAAADPNAQSSINVVAHRVFSWQFKQC